MLKTLFVHRRVARQKHVLGGPSAHMALEQQSLTSEQTKKRIEDLADELIRDMPPDFWLVK